MLRAHEKQDFTLKHFSKHLSVCFSFDVDTTLHPVTCRPNPVSSSQESGYCGHGKYLSFKERIAEKTVY